MDLTTKTAKRIRINDMTLEEVMAALAYNLGLELTTARAGTSPEIRAEWNPMWGVDVELTIRVEYAGGGRRIVAQVSHSAGYRTAQEAFLMSKLLGDAAGMAMYVEAVVRGYTWPMVTEAAK